MPTHDPYAALKNTAFLRTFACYLLTIIAAQIQSTALGWLLYEQTHSAAILGFSGLTIFLPVLLLAIPIGFYVDSHHRRTVFLGGLYILIIGMLMMTFFAAIHTSVPLLFVSLFITGIGNALLSISRPVIMREIMPVHHAENAANWTSLGRRIASIIGPIIAGIVIEMSGSASAAFLISTIFYIAGLVFGLQIKLVARTEPSEKLTLRSLTKGIRYITQTPIILSTTLLDMFAMLLSGATGLLPIYAQDILHVGATGLGFLRAAPSIGSAMMAFTLAHRPPLKRAGMSLLIAVAVFGLMTVLFGISTSPILSFIALLLAGAADAISVTVRATILQVFVPDRFRGRVYGVNMIFVYSSNEFGDFESGMVAAVTNAQTSVILGGIGAMGLALFFGWNWKELRELKKMEVIPNIT